MKKITNPFFPETIYYQVLANGLRVYLIEKTDYQKTFGLFATKYGSLDNIFIPLGKNDYYHAPLGVAHFLEHELFERENGEDVSHQFAQLGAEVNAYTSFLQTAYLFQTIDHVKEAAMLLLDFVQAPFFSSKSVEDEKSIIKQELLMYLDRPSSVLMNSSFKMLYKKNSIRDDIGGTLDSIKEITVNDLKICHETFYHPANMTFILVGNFDASTMLDAIKANQGAKSFKAFKPITRFYHLEDEVVNQVEGSKQMDIKIPKLSVNLKMPYQDLLAPELFKQDFLMDIILEMYFSKTSPFYQKLMDQKIINNSFSTHSAIDLVFGFVTITCETKERDKFKQAIINQLIALKDEVIDQAYFNSIKHAKMAYLIRQMNSLEFWADLCTTASFHDVEPFLLIELLDELNYADLQVFQKHFTSSAIATFEILPLK